MDMEGRGAEHAPNTENTDTEADLGLPSKEAKWEGMR